MSVTSNHSKITEKLAQAFRENEFDIAGLAGLPDDPLILDDCLRLLFEVVNRDKDESKATDLDLAKALHAFLSVAQKDYATDGWSEFWPFLFEHIRTARYAPNSRCPKSVPGGPQKQRLLGSWARHALDAFDYTIPRTRQSNIGPIVYHCGLPNVAINPLIGVLAKGFDVHGHSLPNLPVDMRRQLIERHVTGFRGIPAKTRRFLEGESLGAAELWACFSRVVVGWVQRGNADLELELLPPSIDLSLVRSALADLSVGLRSRSRHRSFPEIKFRPETGHVVLSVPSTDTTAWRLSGIEKPFWIKGKSESTAYVQGPIIEDVAVVSRRDPDLNRSFLARHNDSHWIWFHGHNGNLEDAAILDSRGLGAGRWYVLIEGTPDTECCPGLIRQLQTKWRWFSKHKTWTAWEVQVPVRSHSESTLKWMIDGEEESIELAYRPGAHVELPKPVVTAETSDGQLVDVYDEPPLVNSDSRQPVTLLLTREYSAYELGDPSRIRIDSSQSLLFPIDPNEGPGVFQLRNAKGIGRLVSRLAVIPGFSFDGPHYTDNGKSAAVEVLAPQGGVLEGQHVSNIDGLWAVKDSTVQPALSALWKWDDDRVPAISFSWPVQGIRWRVVSAKDSDAIWTDEVILIDKRDAAGALLEIEVPFDSDIRILGRDLTFDGQKTESGLRVVRKLDSVNEIRFESCGKEFVALIKVDRPIVVNLDVEADHNTFQITAELELENEHCSLVAWDPLDPASRPTVLASCDDSNRNISWIGTLDELPAGSRTAIAVTTLPPRGLSLKKPALRIAVDSKSMRTPCWRFHNEQSSFTSASLIGAANSAYLLAQLSDGLPDFRRKLARDLSEFNPNFSEPVGSDDLIAFEQRIRAWIGEQSHADEELVNFANRLQSARRGHQLLDPLSFFNKLATKKECDAECVELLMDGRHFADFNVTVANWIPPIGASSPELTFPIDYIRDLWLVSRASSEKAKYYNKREASSRIEAHHAALGLPPLKQLHPLNLGSTTEFICRNGRHRHQLQLLNIDNDSNANGDMIINANCYGSASRRKQACSLRWSDKNHVWTIFDERDLINGLATCRFDGALRISPPASDSVSELIDLRKTLNEWDEVSPQESLTGADIDLSFCSAETMSPIAGEWYEEVSRPAGASTQMLWGSAIKQESLRISESIRDIWLISWMDRIVASEGPEPVFGIDDFDAPIIKILNRQLGKVMEQAPTKARKCLILAELLVQIFYRGGAGLPDGSFIYK